MPLTRQEVEALDFSFIPEDETNYRALVVGEEQILPALEATGGHPDAIWRLLAAAPELALACLKARTALLEIGLDDEPGVCEDLLRALDAALALAGVQP